MSDLENPPGGTEEERWIMDTLKRAGHPLEPSEAQMERWSAQFRDALTNVRAERRRRVRATALAAAVLAAVLLLFVSQIPEQSAQALIADVRVVVGSNHVESAGEGRRTPRRGDRVQSGDRLQTGPRGGLAIRIGGTEVRLGSDTRVRLGVSGLELLQGAVYVDSSQQPSNTTPIVIFTRLGSVTHLGTQYLVVLSKDHLLGAVREGRIIVRTDAQSREASADIRSAALIRIAEGGAIRQERTTRHGELWDWVNRVSLGMSVAGRSAHQALTWAARETGRTLEYVDDQAAAAAEKGQLSGSQVRLNTDQILAVVAASTRLTLTTSDPAVLRVGLKSESDEDPG